MSDTLKKVTTIVADHLQIDEAKISAESSFMEDLGADSLDTFELLQGIEQEFGISIAEDEAQNFKTVQDAVQYIDSKK